MRRIFDASAAGLRDAGKREQYSLPLNEARGNFCSRWLALVRRFRLQPLEPLHEQKNHARPETQEHHRNPRDNSPKRAEWRATITVPANNDMDGTAMSSSRTLPRSSQRVERYGTETVIGLFLTLDFAGKFDELCPPEMPTVLF
jgi:hypothetical protein